MDANPYYTMSAEALVETMRTAAANTTAKVSKDLLIVAADRIELIQKAIDDLPHMDDPDMMIATISMIDCFNNGVDVDDA